MKILVNDFAGHPFQVQLSRALARSGNTVLHTYFGANDTPKGEVDIHEDNLTIHNVVIACEFEKHSLRSRRTADLQYGNAVRDCIREFAPEAVISANTPLDAQRIILAATRMAGGRFIFWLQDLLSAGIEFALRKRHVPLASAAGYLYRRLERRLLEESDAIVCIAPEFLQILQKWKVALGKTFLIENWAPIEEIPSLPRCNSWGTEQQLTDKFCFMYAGTLGMKHKPELLLELAHRFESRDDVVTMVIGEGAGARWLRERQDRLRPGALRVLPFQPYRRMGEVLASADVLVALLEDECGSFAVPSKTLAYLCSGRPLLVAAPEGNLASRVVYRASAGVSVPPHRAAVLEAAKCLLDDGEARRQFGANARHYAETAFNIDRIRDEFLSVLEFSMHARLTDSSHACRVQ